MPASATDPGELIDLYVLPRAPFAMQVVRSFSVAADATVSLLDGVRTPITVASLDTPNYSGATNILLTTVSDGANSSLGFSVTVPADTRFGPTPSTYLAPTHTYVRD